MTLLLAEDLMLLRVDPKRGTIRLGGWLSLVMGGAALTDLALAGVIDIPAGSHERGGPEVRVTGDLADPLLRMLLVKIAEEPRAACELVGTLGAVARPEVLARMVDSGLLRRESRRALGVVSFTRWPPVHPAVGDPLRASLSRVLLDDVQPSPRIAALVSLLHATSVAQRSINRGGQSRRAVLRRANQISLLVTESDWSGVTAGRAVRATEYAVTYARSSGESGGGGG